MFKRSLPLALILSGLFYSISPAFADGNTKGKQFALDQEATVKNIGTTVNPTDVPGYTGATPPQTSYYNSGLSIEEQAKTFSATDPNAQYIEQSRNNRPTVVLDQQTDPLFKRHEEITTKSMSLTDTYSGCVDLPVGGADVTAYTEKHCKINGQQDKINYSCTKDLLVNCPNTNKNDPLPFKAADFSLAGNTPFPRGQTGSTFWFGGTNDFRDPSPGNCGDFVNIVTFHVENISQIVSMSIDSIVYDDWAQIDVNGEKIFTGIGPNQGVDLPWVGTCEYKKNFSAGSFDITSKIKEGFNSITVRNRVGGKGSVYFSISGNRRVGCIQDISSKTTCPVGETVAGGTFTGSSCTAGPSTRIIDGMPVWKDCWQWNENYWRWGAPYFVKDADCLANEAAGCGSTTAICESHNGKFCVTQDVTYQCPYTTSARKVSMCGSNLVCPDGQCTQEVGQTYDPATEDFKKAATSLAVANEVAANFNEETLTVFNGNDKKCEKKALGFSNCCQDSGWGADAGLASCSSEEKQLGLEKEAGRTHYVGSYDSGSFLNEKTYKVYCTYPSKLARLIIVQGKQQMGVGFGTPKEPVCTGFTIADIEALNFDAMDFSEVYSDALAKAEAGSTPTANSAAEDIKNKLKAKYPEIDE